jgi:hypothetical protein
MKKLTIEQLEDIANALGVTIKELMFDEKGTDSELENQTQKREIEFLKKEVENLTKQIIDKEKIEEFLNTSCRNLEATIGELVEGSSDLLDFMVGVNIQLLYEKFATKEDNELITFIGKDFFEAIESEYQLFLEHEDFCYPTHIRDEAGGRKRVIYYACYQYYFENLIGISPEIMPILIQIAKPNTYDNFISINPCFERMEERKNNFKEAKYRIWHKNHV